MTHCNDDGIQIKVEPISPLEIPGAYEEPMDTCDGQFSLQSVDCSSLMPDGLGGEEIKMEGEVALGTSPGTRKALKYKIQSGRRARGQEELVVKFEPTAKRELTDLEVRKRERRKEQNRRAAQKCRVKKRELQSKAMQQFTNLLQENGVLKNETIELKSEVSRLKCILQEHTNSGLCKLVSIPTHQSVFNSLAATPTPDNHITPQVKAPNTEKLRRMEELKRQASIEKIVKDLEMIPAQGQQYLPEELPNTVIPFDVVEKFLQLIESQKDDQENCSPCNDVAETQSKDTAAVDNLLEQEGGPFWCPDLGMNDSALFASSNRQGAVRNLNEEFARCANANFSETTISPSPATVPFSSHPQQQAITIPNYNNNNNNNSSSSSSSINSTNNSLQRTPLHLEQLSNGDFPHTNTAFGSNFHLSNELSPISPYSSCTSPPSNLTSPSMFQSPAELHRCSPDTGGYSQVPNIFRFPPDARFSPSS